jgi:thiol-disulfide isomerase/thioredoxin
MKTLFFSLMVILVFGCYGIDPVNTTHIGKKLPSFNILDKDSTVFSTQQIPEGQPLVLFYFSPYCPYCRAQMEDIIGNIESLKDIKFYMVTSFPYQDMVKFLKHYKVEKYPNISVGVDMQNYFSSYFDAKGVPATAIFNKEKKLNAFFMGQMDVRQIKEVAEQ